ncbi:MAG: hypothetical protein ABSC13_09355, partial [Dehalococcoidia bacterium]
MNAAFATLLFAHVTGDRVGDWLITHGLKIVVILAVVLAVFVFLRIAVPPVIDAAVRRQMLGRPAEETSKRSATLVNAFLR